MSMTETTTRTTAHRPRTARGSAFGKFSPSERRHAEALYGAIGSWHKVARDYYGVTAQTLLCWMGRDAYDGHGRSRKPRAPRGASADKPRPVPVDRVHHFENPEGSSLTAAKRRQALYDPERDGAPVYDSIGAAVFGDPPIGRRQMLDANAARTAPSDRHPNFKDWHF